MKNLQNSLTIPGWDRVTYFSRFCSILQWLATQTSSRDHPSDPEFAEDEIVSSDSPVPVQPTDDWTALGEAKVSLEIKTRKTKTFSTFSISNFQEHQRTASYLNGRTIDEVTTSIDNVRRALMRLRQLSWARSEISHRTKIGSSPEVVQPVVSYTRRLGVFDYWCFWITRKTKQESNVATFKTAHLSPIASVSMVRSCFTVLWQGTLSANKCPALCFRWFYRPGC